MKRRTLTVPVLSKTQLTVMNLTAIGGNIVAIDTGDLTLRTVCTALTSWCVFSSVRGIWFKGKPLTLAVGKAPAKPELETQPETRAPKAWPPEPGQCFICGMSDPDLEKVFGDATHPACRDWLGDWKPSGFVTGKDVRILTGSPVPHFETSAIPGFKYSWSCHCMQCISHYGHMRDRRNGHPANCSCLYCLRLSNARYEKNPHHKSCNCTPCYLEGQKD